VLLEQARITAACNALHHIDARFCRWLLQTRDRAETRVFAIRIDGRSTWRFQGLHHADARKHRWSAQFHNGHHALDSGLPLIELLVGLRKSGDVVAGVFEGDETAAIRQHNRIQPRSAFTPRPDLPGTASDNLERVTRQRPLQRLRLIPGARIHTSNIVKISRSFEIEPMGHIKARSSALSK
jgi:hypothetical protein